MKPENTNANFDKLLTDQKVDCSVFTSRTLSVSHIYCHSKCPIRIFKEHKLSLNPEIVNFPLNAVHLNFLDRLNLAWKITFPSSATKRSSNTNIAKQRLKMILFSDRCAVSDEAKQKIVSNVVSVLSDFVEIESQDKVQLSVSTDPDLGTIYYVTVRVRKVRSEYQIDDEIGMTTNIENKDIGERSGFLDVKLIFMLLGTMFKILVCKNEGDD